MPGWWINDGVSLDPAPGTIAAVFVALADPSHRQVIGVLAARWLDTAAGAWYDRLAVKKAAERASGPAS